jgi:hypothetical protein
MTGRVSGPVTQLCPCSSRHSPPITEAELDWHHAPPLSWPLALGGGTRKVRVCVCCHRRAHRLLNLYVHNDGPPSKADLRQFRPIERELAQWSWDNADHNGPVHLPYTLDGGESR